MEFPTCELPDLCIVHGVNGAGKTHMLRALESGCLVARDKDGTDLTCVYASDFVGINPFGFAPSGADENHRKAYTAFAKFSKKSKASQDFVSKFCDAELVWALKDTDGGEVILMRDALSRATEQDFQNYLDHFFDEYRTQKPHAPNSRSEEFTKSNVIEAFVRATRIPPTEVKLSDFQYPVSQAIHSSLLTPSLGRLFHAYYRAQKAHKRSQIIARAGGREALSDDSFKQQYGNAPWDSYNERLRMMGLDFEVAVPPDLNDEHWQILLRKGGSLVNFDQISSGEKVNLNLVLASLARSDQGLKINKPDLILLDEVDAHLHPALVREVFSSVLNPLISSGSRIIITTHSPTTIALVDEASIFEKTSRGGLLKTGKQTAIDKLLVGVPHIAIDSSGRRQVFVESTIDEFIYSELYIHTQQENTNGRSLTFIGAGAEKNGGKDRVKATVQALRNAGNMTVYGLIDWDLAEVGDKFIHVSGSGLFYSVENVILNPLILGAALIRDRLSQDLERFNYMDVPHMSCGDLQLISNMVSHRILGETLDFSEKVDLINGQRIFLPKQACAMNGHEWEKLVMQSVPQLRAVRAGPEQSLKKAIVLRVLRDASEIFPAFIRDVFTSLLKA